VILSHIVADFALGSPLVSFLWPFEVAWAGGHIGWSGVIGSVFLDAFNDLEIIIISLVLAVAIRFIRGYPETPRDFFSKACLFVKR